MGASRKLLGLVCSISAVALVWVGASPAFAAGARSRVGSLTPRPQGARVTGRLPAARRLRLTVELASRDPLGLAAFARAVATPGTAQYGHFLSVGEFARRFGAPASRIALVAAALRREGLRVSRPSRNALQLSVSGTVGRIDRAFAVSEQAVRMPDGRGAYANAQSPTLPVALASGIQGVIGLDDLVAVRPGGLADGRRLAGARPRSRRIAAVSDNGGPQPCSQAVATAQSSGFGVTADAVASAYGLSSLYAQSDFGQGQSVALVEFEGFNSADVGAYQTCYGTAAQVSTINVDGGPDYNSDDSEAALDIEQVIGLAPRAQVDVFQAPSADSTAAVLGAILSAGTAKVISDSWGMCEADAGPTALAATNTLLQEAAAQGESFFASSGDTGSSGCDDPYDGYDQSLALIDPASQPWATSVGGTVLYGGVDGLGNVLPYTAGGSAAEAVWNDGSGSATGGGISSIWAMPAYQSGAAASLGVRNGYSASAPCGSATDCREVPDVSGDADPGSGYAIAADGGWHLIGGTSASAPLWASFTALANASSACRGLSLGFLNPSLYAIAGAAYGTDFRDISGTNPLTGADSNDGYAVSGGDPNGDRYPVSAGYDMATGLGSMIAGPLAQSLCAARHSFAVAVVSPGARTGTVGRAITVRVSASDSGGAALSYSASGLPGGLAINPATGVISGTPTTPGTAAVTVSASDGYGNAGSAQFTITIEPRTHPTGAQLSARRMTLSGLTRGRPLLAFLLSAGAGRITGFELALPKGLAVSRRPRTLGAGLSIRAGGHSVGFRAIVVGRTLAVKLRVAAKGVRVTLDHRALKATRAEVRGIRRHVIRRVTLVITIMGSDRLRHRERITIRRLT